MDDRSSVDVTGVPVSEIKARNQALAGSSGSWGDESDYYIVYVNGEFIRLPINATDMSLFISRTYLVGGYGTVRRIYDAIVDKRHDIKDHQPIYGVPDNYQHVSKELKQIDKILELLSGAWSELAQFEEFALRWYETKLLEVIDSDFDFRKKEIARAWRTIYKIGDPKRPKKQSEIYHDANLDKFAIRGQRDEVIAAAHSVARKWYDYLEAIWSRQAHQSTPGHQYDEKGLSSAAAHIIDKYKEFVTTRDEHTKKHFIVLRVFRDVIQRPSDQTYDAKIQTRIEGLIIKAMHETYMGIPSLISDFEQSAVFKDSPQLLGVISNGLDLGPFRAYVAKGNDLTKVNDLSKSLWIQLSLHERMRLIANELVNRKQQTVQKNNKVAGSSTQKGSNDSTATTGNGKSSKPASATDDTTPPNFEVVSHLLGLFEENDEALRLQYFFSAGSMANQAREEAIQTLLETLAQDKAKWKTFAAGVNIIGFILTPFTDGTSFLVASAIDAALVGKITTEEIAQHMRMHQLSKEALDAIADTYWTDPALADLIGTVFEASLQIASDLVTKGTLSHVLNGVMIMSIILSTKEAG